MRGDEIPDATVEPPHQECRIVPFAQRGGDVAADHNILEFGEIGCNTDPFLFKNDAIGRLRVLLILRFKVQMSAGTYDNLSMDGKVAVVTGSTQGLGEAIAHLFVDRGAKGIVITGRNETRGAKVKAALAAKGAKGAKVIFVQGELGNIGDVRKVMAACDQEFGKVDALVNAAAITDRGSI